MNVSKYVSSDPIRLVIPYRAVPKARPRVTKRGTFMPASYRQFLTTARRFVLAAVKENGQIDGPVALIARFMSDSIELAIQPLHGRRAKYVRGDVDNLVGGLMDALQSYRLEGQEIPGLIENDRQVVEIWATAVERDSDGNQE